MTSRRKLFISGGGGAKDSLLLDKEFIALLPRKKILYIPIGLERDIMGYEDCYNWLFNTLSPHCDKPIDITMLISLQGKTNINVDTFDAIYIGGSKYSNKLLNIIRDNNFDKDILRFIRNGGIVYGGSAGAVIFGKHTDILNEENNVQSPQNGLNLIGGFSVYCHYNEIKNNQIMNYVNNYGASVLAIPEDSGVVVEGKVFTVFGYNNVVIFKKNTPPILIMPGNSYGVSQIDD